LFGVIAMTGTEQGKSALAARLATFGPRPAAVEPPVRHLQIDEHSRQQRVEPHALQSRVEDGLANTATGTRFFVLGRADDAAAFGAISLVTNPEEPFDVILGVPASDLRRVEAQLSELLPYASNPAAPLIVHNLPVGPRADVVLASTSASELAAAIVQAQRIASRLSSLPKIPRGPERNRLLALTLAYTRDAALEATWAPGSRTMIGYPLLLGMTEPRSMLEELADSGLLTRRFFDRVYVCGHCSSSRLLAREVCVKCHSSHIEEEALLHHYPCGFQAAEAHFRINGGGYQCPKCSKQLRHFGVDYDKPGMLSKCCHCHEHNAEPDTYFACADCGHFQPSHGAKRQTWHHYAITPDGIAAVKAGTIHRAEGDNSSHGQSLRDFRVLSRQALALATQHGRPIVAFRMRIDTAALAATVGVNQVAEICLFAREIAGQSLCDSDIVVPLRDGLICCLPETDDAEARKIVKHISGALAAGIKHALAPSFDIQVGPVAVAAMLKGLM
jgi:TackOD1 domain-containing protein